MHLGWVFFFFFNDTATTEIYTLSLHDALPIYDDHLRRHRVRVGLDVQPGEAPKSEHDEHEEEQDDQRPADRKSTRLNSSHANISYAVFCLKKKQKLVTNSKKCHQ